MKKSLTCLLLCAAIQCTYARTSFPSREKIAEAVADTAGYNALTARFLADDKTMTVEDYACLYYGFALQSSYMGYLGYEFRIVEIQGLLRAGNAAEAKTKCEELIAMFPVSPTAWWLRHSAGYELDEPREVRQGYIFNMMKIVSAILESGDGLTQETGFDVISLSDQYRVMWALDINRPNGRENHGKTDCWLITPDARFTSGKLWFVKSGTDREKN